MPNLPKTPNLPNLPNLPTMPNAPSSISPLPILAGSVHFFFYSTVFLKVALQPFNQADNQSVGLMNQRNSDIGDLLIVAILYFISISLRVVMLGAETTRLY